MSCGTSIFGFAIGYSPTLQVAHPEGSRPSSIGLMEHKPPWPRNRPPWTTDEEQNIDQIEHTELGCNGLHTVCHPLHFQYPTVLHVILCDFGVVSLAPHHASMEPKLVHPTLHPIEKY